MVFFVCEGCNETLKKNQVEKHTFKCRNCYAVTCVDCQKTFPDDTYAQHTECISEAEKYEGSLYQGGKKKKKASPQEMWNQCIETATNKILEAPQRIRYYIEKLGQQSNVPRNKNKFSNFVKNSFRLNDERIIEEMWSFLERYKRGSNDQIEENILEKDNNHKPAVIEDSRQCDLEREETEREGSKEGKKMKKEKKKLKRKRNELERCNLEDECFEEGRELEKSQKIDKEKKEKKKKKSKKERDDQSDAIECELSG